jgi:hypothetical protein
MGHVLYSRGIDSAMKEPVVREAARSIMMGTTAAITAAAVSSSSSICSK